MSWKEIKYNAFDWLRFPLVLLVVFLHCKGTPDDMHIDWINFGVMDGYNFLRIYISNFTIIFSIAALYMAYICVQRKCVLILLKLARASFVVYASHMVFISRYIKIFVDRLVCDSVYFLFIDYILVPIMTSSICVLIYFVVRRFCPNLLLLLSGGR